MNEELEYFCYLHYFDPSDCTDNYEREDIRLCKSFPCPNWYIFYPQEFEEYNNTFVRPSPEQESLLEPVPLNTGRFSALASWQETRAATPRTSRTPVAPAVLKLSEWLFEYTALANLTQLPIEVLDFAPRYDILEVTYETGALLLFLVDPTMAEPLQLTDVLAMINGLAT